MYHYAKASTPSGIDYVYLAGLSPDAHYYKDALPKLLTEIEKSNTDNFAKTNPAYTILGNIDSLRYKYETKKAINAFNIAEYQEYLDTKDLDLENYRQRLSAHQQKITPK
jgi:hypothetical protein